MTDASVRPPKQKRSQESLERVLQAGAEVLLDVGYEGFTLQEVSKRSGVSIGSIYACLGEKDLAFEWLEKAMAQHDNALMWIKVHPRLDRLRDDPRYLDLLQRTGHLR